MSGKPDAVMLFAAGFGTRMGALTCERPKPMVEVAGRPLIDHALALVEAVEPVRKVANLHYLPDSLAAHLGPQGVLLSNEQPEILDTGGGLKAALPLLEADTVFTMNTDAIWSGPNVLHLLAEAWKPERMDALLICVPLEQTVGRKGSGDFSLDEEGRIKRGGGLVYGGVQIIKTAMVADYPKQVFSLNAIWDILAEHGRLFGAIYPGRWCDVGHPEGIELAENLLLETDV